MAIEKIRGKVNNLKTPPKQGTATFRLDGRDIIVPQDLVDKVREGEDIEVAGTISKGALHAMAVRNVKQDRISRVDVTLYVLLIGIAGFLWVLCGVLGLRAMGTGAIITESVDDIVAIAGFIIVLMAIRHLSLINKASNQLRYPWL